MIGKSWATSSFLKTNLHFENHQKNGIMVGKDSAKSNSAFRIKGQVTLYQDKLSFRRKNE